MHLCKEKLLLTCLGNGNRVCQREWLTAVLQAEKTLIGWCGGRVLVGWLVCRLVWVWKVPRQLWSSDCRQSWHSSHSTALTVSCEPTSVLSCTSYPALIDHDDIFSLHVSSVWLHCASWQLQSESKAAGLASWQEIFLACKSQYSWK